MDTRHIMMIVAAVAALLSASHLLSGTGIRDSFATLVNVFILPASLALLLSLTNLPWVVVVASLAALLIAGNLLVLQLHFAADPLAPSLTMLASAIQIVVVLAATLATRQILRRLRR